MRCRACREPFRLPAAACLGARLRQRRPRLPRASHRPRLAQRPLEPLASPGRERGHGRAAASRQAARVRPRAGRLRVRALHREQPRRSGDREARPHPALRRALSEDLRGRPPPQFQREPLHHRQTFRIEEPLPTPLYFHAEPASFGCEGTPDLRDAVQRIHGALERGDHEGFLDELSLRFECDERAYPDEDGMRAGPRMQKSGVTSCSPTIRAPTRRSTCRSSTSRRAAAGGSPTSRGTTSGTSSTSPVGRIRSGGSEPICS